MSFNLILDYFNKKGKDRKKIESINIALELMQKYIEKGYSSINKRKR